MVNAFNRAATHGDRWRPHPPSVCSRSLRSCHVHSLGWSTRSPYKWPRPTRFDHSPLQTCQKQLTSWINSTARIKPEVAKLKVELIIFGTSLANSLTFTCTIRLVQLDFRTNHSVKNCTCTYTLYQNVILYTVYVRIQIKWWIEFIFSDECSIKKILQNISTIPKLHHVSYLSVEEVCESLTPGKPICRQITVASVMVQWSSQIVPHSLL